jgi:hypothetical protein
MKKLTSFLLTATALFAAISVSAQTTDTVTERNWFHRDIVGAGQLQFTYRQGDISGLNNALTANGLRPISVNNLWINVSMHHDWQNWVTEDGIGFTPVAGSANDGLYAKYNQYQIYLRLGYNVLPAGNVKLYPFVGANVSAGVLNIEDNNGVQRTNSLSGEILNSTADKTLYQPNFGVELGVGLDYLIPVAPKKMNCLVIKRNIPIGIRAGYYINTYAADWHINSYTLPAGPNQKQSAAFISLNIGLGYEVQK